MSAGWWWVFYVCSVAWGMCWGYQTGWYAGAIAEHAFIRRIQYSSWENVARAA